MHSDSRANPDYLFEQALGLPDEERSAFLDAACEGNPELRAELHSLLQFYDEASHFFNRLGLAVNVPNATMVQDQPGPSQLVGSTLGPYEVLSHLGGGGMGVVYKAKDTRLFRTVALKFLPPHLGKSQIARLRFMQEARAASALDHPNICAIYDIGETEEGSTFIAMAYYEGMTLKRKIDQGPLLPGKAIEYAIQIAQGLVKAHAQGIIHRDIKPANVMVTNDDVIKVLDFGLAKMADSNLTASHVVMGTAAYMSPEQAQGQRVDARTDIWALGVVLYEMVTGRRPFWADNDQAMIYQVLNSAPRPVAELRADLPEELIQLIDQCLEKDPEDRYPDMQHLLADLQAVRQLLDAEGPTNMVSSWTKKASAPPLRARAKGARRKVALRKKQRGIAAGVALVLVAALVGWFLWPSAPETGQLAVLPLQIIGDVADADAFSTGLVETLTSKLTQLEQFQRSFWVLPASEISGAMTPSDAWAQFGVTLAVTGSLQMEGERARLTLNLIEARTRRQLASNQRDLRLTSVLALQDEAILMLVRMLRMRLQPEDEDVLRAGGTTQPYANQFYLQGVGYLRNHQTVEDLERAIGMFEQALDEDASFALAYAGLGEALWQKYRLTSDVQWVEQAIANSERALALNDQLAPVYVTLGLVYSGQQQYDQALEAFDQALAIDPVNPEAHRRKATVLRRQGRLDEAEVTYQQAISLNPGYWRGYNSLGVFYYAAGQYEQAVEQFSRGLQLAPSNSSLLVNQGASYWGLERLNEAVAAFEQVLALDPDNQLVKSNLATAYYYQGAFEKAAALFEEALAAQPNNYTTQGYLADTYSLIPEARDRAAAAYQRAIDLARTHLEVSLENTEVLASLANYHAHLGQRDSALVYLAEVETRVDPSVADVTQVFGVGETYEFLGDRAQAIRWTRSALERGYGRIQMQHSPWLTELRTDPAIQPLIAAPDGS